MEMFLGWQKVFSFWMDWAVFGEMGLGPMWRVPLRSIRMAFRSVFDMIFVCLKKFLFFLKMSRNNRTQNNFSLAITNQSNLPPYQFLFRIIFQIMQLYQLIVFFIVIL